GEHWNQRERNQEGARQRENDDEGERLEEVTRGRSHEDERQKNYARRQRRRHDGPGDLARTDLCGLDQPATPFFPLPNDVLQDYDGIVHHHPDTESQAAERHLIQRHPPEIEDAERRDHRNGNGEGDDEGGRAIPQEQIQDEDGEQAAPDGRRLHVRDALADERALVADHVDLQVVAFGIDEVDLPLDGIGDGDRVGAALLLDGDAHD